MKKDFFGKMPDGEDVFSYRLENEEIFAEIITFGAAIRKFGLASGEETNIVGSFNSLGDYIADTSHQGAIIGRVANRIANAEFTIDGITYHLPKNNKGNCLHGGVGFDRKVWSVEDCSSDSIMLSYYSNDGEEGFPGGVSVTVKYTLLGSALIIEYKAYPEAKTPIALTNHAYFNLDGFGGNVYAHKAQIFAERYSAVNENLIPTGEHPLVAGTALDLREPRTIGDAISEEFIGYDHNFILSPTVFADFLGKRLGLAARISSHGTSLSVYTDMKDIQFYTANFLSGNPDFDGGIKKVKHGAFCLETQTEPNAVNSKIGIYGKGEVYTHTSAFELKKI